MNTEVSQSTQTLIELQQSTARRIARLVALLAWPLVAGAAYEAFTTGLYGLSIFYTLVYLLVLATVVLETRINYRLQAYTVFFLAYGVGAAGIAQQGLASDARWFLLLPPVLAGIFLGLRESLFASGFSIALLLGLGLLFARGILQPFSPPPSSADFAEWVLTTLIYLVLNGLIVATLHYLLPRLVEAEQTARTLAQDLTREQAEMARQAERSQKRARRFEQAAELSRILARVTEQQAFFREVPRLVAQAFDLYQVNLYTLDPRGETLHLTSAASAEAQALAEQGYLLRLTENSPLVRAALLNQPEAQLVEAHPFFPESKAMVALPLGTRGELLGVLEIHGRYEAFDDDDIHLFQILAEQIAALGVSLRLVAESEARLSELRMLYARYAGVAWIELLRELDLPPVQLGRLDPAALAALKADVGARQEPRSALLGDQYVLLVPLVARGLNLGTVALARPAAQGDWPLETTMLVRSAAERLAFALDNTRLLLESQQRALYEEQLSHLGQAVWSTMDMEGVMEQGVTELGRLLQASEVILWLTSPTASR